jgi:membrane-associated phospholipid phosphatase
MMQTRSLLEASPRTFKRRRRVDPSHARAAQSPRWRGVVAGPVVAIVTVLTALVATRAAGLPLRDPDHVAALYLALVGCAMAVLVGLDIVIRAGRRSGTLRPSRAAIRRVQRERWTPARGLGVGIALVSFYVTYMAYRNLKAIVPLLRPGELFDRQLADLDRSLFGGNDPAALMHTLLGTGIPTQLLSAAYVAFIVFLPLSLALALVFSPDLQAGLFYATALSINWILGAASYFLLPSLGPIYADPAAFAHLPVSEVTHLQDVLLDQRVEFLRDPTTGTPQSIAAFASLHIAMSLTAAVAAHLLGAGKRLKIALWIWFALTTVSTIYLGWHYVLDDLGGLVIGVTALVLARALTGFDLRIARQPRRMTGASKRTRSEGDHRPGTVEPRCAP